MTAALRLSVIMPSYRRAPSLRRAVLSLCVQTCAPAEIVVAVWDGDADTVAILDELGSHAEAAGITWRPLLERADSMVARQNAGINAASGDVVVFMDDDAAARSDWLQRIATHYDNPRVGAVGGRDVIWVDGVELTGRARRIGAMTWFGRLHANHHRPSHGVREVSFLKGCNMSYRRALVGELDPLLLGPVPYGYEIDLGLRVRTAGYRLIYDAGAAVDHYPSSVMAADDERISRRVNHNQTYVLLKHLRGGRRLAFVAYTVLVGDLTTVGLLRIPGLRRRGWTAAQVRAHLDGKLAGLRTYARSRRQRAAGVLLYSYPFAPQVGGLERLTQRTAEVLAGRGVAVDVVTDTPANGCADVPAEYGLHRRPGARELWRVTRRAAVVQLNSFDIRVFAFAKVLRRPIVWQHTDYHTICPRGTCMRGGAPCSFDLQRCWGCLRSDDGRLRSLRVLVAFGTKVLASRRVRRNVVTSDYSAQRVHLPAATMLPLGIDTRSFSPARPATRAAKTGKAFTVVFSGRHIEAKGADVLLHALAACRDRGLHVRAVLAGDGPHRSSSQELAAEMGLTDCVDFPGFVAEDRLVELVRSAGAVVVPPLHDECYGLTAAEAMSCGAPVIAAAVGGLPEVVGDAGLLFPAGDAEALADCIAKLAGDAKLRKELGARGRLHAAARLSDQAMVDGYQAIYREVCSPKAGRRLSAEELA